MEAYQKRMIEEREELGVKINKLEEFFYSQSRRDLDIKDQSLLSSQLHAMISYQTVLGERIERFS